MSSATYVVVFQMGKVASTSLVSTLNRVEGVTAVQSHFLGDEALRDIIRTITPASVSAYFAEHQIGQLVVNLRITREINILRSGNDPRNLLVLSLARAPMDWFRSAFMQDISGYLPLLRDLAPALDLDCQTETELVTRVLPAVLDVFANIVNREHGMDGCLTRHQGAGAAILEGTRLAHAPGALRLLHLMLRPLNWFELHFNRALGLDIDRMARDGLVWHQREGRAHFAVIRYEDMRVAFPAVLDLAGIAQPPEVLRENVSSDKRLVDEVRAAFASPEADRLRPLFAATRYARRFGYGDTETPAG